MVLKAASIVCISCKIMERVLCSHLSNHLEISNILTRHQHGFRKGFSTETQLISVLDDWLSLLDKRIRTDVIFIDFSNAFNSVSTRNSYLSLIIMASLVIVFFGLRTSFWTALSVSRFLVQSLLGPVLPLVSPKAKS